MSEKLQGNPFVLGKEIDEAYFCDRQKETEFLMKQVENGRDVALISPRRLGKTGLVGHLFRQSQIASRYQTFLIDIYATSSLPEFVYLLGKTIFETLKFFSFYPHFFTFFTLFPTIFSSQPLFSLFRSAHSSSSSSAAFLHISLFSSLLPTLLFALHTPRCAGGTRQLDESHTDSQLNKSAVDLTTGRVTYRQPFYLTHAL